MSFANIGDAAVDEYAGVYELHQRSSGRRRGDIRLRGQGDMPHVSPTPRADHEPEVAEREQRSELDKGLGGFGFRGAGNNEGNEEGYEQAQNDADRPSHKSADLRVTKS